jgi:hypothetical protein
MTEDDFAQLGKPRDSYERQQMALCERSKDDPDHGKFVRLVIKHLTARRQHLQDCRAKE